MTSLSRHTPSTYSTHYGRNTVNSTGPFVGCSVRLFGVKAHLFVALGYGV